MWDEVKRRGERFLELKGLVEDPAHAGKPAFGAWWKEFGRLKKFGELYAAYLDAQKAAADAQGILKDPASDADFKALAEEELQTAQQKAGELREQLLDLVQEEDEDAGRNVIVELYAGVGGDESALWVGDLYDMFKRFCDKKGWKVTVTDSNPGNVGGFSDLTFRVEGDGAYDAFRFEGGGHRVQRVPKTETQGRVHTSMARVAVLPEVEEVEVQVDPKEVKETFCAAGGPGGQNVNKVATQCQLLHIPTGIMVRCLETRSQATNKQRAWQILRSKIYQLRKAEADAKRGNARQNQIGSGDRSERVRTYNFPQGRCTDHRLEGDDKNWGVTEITAGNLDDLHAKLREARKRQSRGEMAAD